MPRGLPDSFVYTLGRRLLRNINRRPRVATIPTIRTTTYDFSIKYKRLKIYDSILYTELHLPTGVVWNHFKNRGLYALREAKKDVGVKTGALRKSIYYRHTPAPYGQKITIGATKNYALAHHEGTRPHQIHAKNGGVLVFARRGRVIRTPMVNHPGTRPNKFLSRQLIHFLF